MGADCRTSMDPIAIEAARRAGGVAGYYEMDRVVRDTPDLVPALRTRIVTVSSHKIRELLVGLWPDTALLSTEELTAYSEAYLEGGWARLREHEETFSSAEQGLMSVEENAPRSRRV